MFPILLVQVARVWSGQFLCSGRRRGVWGHAYLAMGWANGQLEIVDLPGV